MTIVPIAPVTNVPSVPYPFVPPPFTDVAPLTYRDGTTYLEYLRGLNNWIQNTLIPYINDNLTALGNDYLDVANNLINTVNTALTSQTDNINTALSTQETNVNNALAAMQTQVDQAVTDVENSAISVQDPVVEGILTNPTSQSRVALNGIFEQKSTLDADVAGYVGAGATRTALDGIYLDKTDAVSTYRTIADAENLYPKKNDLYVNVMDHGAKGDGTSDDTAAIQSAINATVGSRGVVIFPEGVFIVTLVSGLDYMLEIKAGITLRGTSRTQSVIKVKNTTGDYRAIMTGVATNTDLSGFTIENLTIDNNNTLNPASSTAPMFAGYPRYTVYAPNANNVRVRNITITDIDSVNTIVVTGNNNELAENVFTGIGTSIGYHDHSTIYMSGDGLRVRNNYFYGVSGGKGATTAIETHASRQIVSDNLIYNYYAGMNITGVQTALSDQIDVHDNVMNGVNSGIFLWSQQGGLKNVKVHHNLIEISHDPWIRGVSDYSQGICVYPTNTSTILNLSIEHNEIVYNAYTVAAQSGELSAAGITLSLSTPTYGAQNLRIIGNLIKGAYSAAIRLNCTISNGIIKDNQIVDPGSSQDTGMPSLYKCGLIIVGGHYNDLIIDDNRTLDTRSPHVINAGINTSAVTGTTRVRTKENRVSCADNVTLVPVAASSYVSSLLIEEEIDVYAGSATPQCNVGSRIRDLATGDTWVQTASPAGNTWAQRAL